MRSVLVQLDDDETYRALSRVVPREEYRKIRRAYEVQPDSGSDVDAWSNPEEFAI